MQLNIQKLGASILVWTIIVSFGACSKSRSPNPQTAPKTVESINKPTEFVRDAEVVERVSKEVSASFSRPIIAALRKSDFSQLPVFLSKDFRAKFLPLTTLGLSKSSTVSVRPLRPDEAWLDSAGFVERFRKLMKRLSVVEQVSFRIFETLLVTSGQRVVVQAHWNIAGQDETRIRHQWSMTVEAELIPGARAGEWLLKKLDLREASYAISRGRRFQDIAAHAGLQLHETAENRENAKILVDLRQLTQSGGLTVLDFNHDDFWDIIATRKNRVAGLFINDGRGGFSKADFAPFNDARKIARFYLNVDLDNDGQAELVSTRVEQVGKKTASLSLIQIKGGKAKELKGRLSFSNPHGLRDMNFEGLTACDVNQDNLLDLVVVGYSHWESLRDKFNLVDGRDGLQNLLFINQGNLHFKEESVARGLSKTQYSYVAECTDFDDDGDADIFIGNDYGQNVFYENRGQGQFVEDASHPFSRAHGFSMGISRADYDNTGHYAVSISNMYSHAGSRIVPLVSDLSEEMHKVVLNYARGNALFEYRRGRYEDVAKVRGVHLADWAWGNIFFDVDNDADKDLYVVNGFTSHQDPTAPDW